MLALLAAFLAAAAAFNYLMNPYGAWRVALVDGIFRRIEHERLETPYLLRTAEPTTLLVGSSRVLMGVAVEQGCRDGIENAGLSGASVDEIGEIVAIALRKSRLKRLIWGVDFYAFDQNYLTFDPATRRRLGRNLSDTVTDTLLSLDAFDASRKLLLRSIGGRSRLPAMRVLPLPWPQSVIRRELEQRDQRGLDQQGDREYEVLHGVPRYADYRLAPDRLAEFRDTVERARASGVEVVLFLPPLSRYELEVIRQSGQWQTLQRWKRELLAAGPYWDFCGYNALSGDDRLFLDAMHFKPAAGQVILRLIVGQDCSRCGAQARVIANSGLWVDRSTLERVLTIEDTWRSEAVRNPSRYSRTVAKIIARPAPAAPAALTPEARPPDGAATAAPR